MKTILLQKSVKFLELFVIEKKVNRINYEIYKVFLNPWYRTSGNRYSYQSLK